MRQKHYRSNNLLTNRQFHAARRFATHLEFEGYLVHPLATSNADVLRDELPRMLLYASELPIFTDAVQGWSFDRINGDECLSEFFAAQLAFSLKPCAISVLGTVLRTPIFLASVEAAEHLGDLVVLLPPSELRNHVCAQLASSNSPLSRKELLMTRRNALFERSDDWTDTTCYYVLSQPFIADPIDSMRFLLSGWA